MRAGIFGVGSALPEHVVSNSGLTESLDTSDEWIVKRTGIRERRWLNGAQGDLLYAEADERLVRMEGRDVYRHAVRRMADAARSALARAGLEPADLDLLVAHQANARIVEATALELGIPADRVALNLDRVANTSSASIPLALHDAERSGRLWPGARVGLVAFGAGFVWAAGVIAWKERAPVYA